MKRAFAVLALVSLGAGAIQAQNPEPRQRRMPPPRDGQLAPPRDDSMLRMRVQERFG